MQLVPAKSDDFVCCVAVYVNFPPTTDIRLDKAITLVCKSSTVSKRWRQIFGRLSEDSNPDITEEADEIEAIYIDDAICCHQALSRWKDSANKPTVWNLVDALRSTNCTIVAGLYFMSYQGLFCYLQNYGTMCRLYIYIYIYKIYITYIR